MSCDMRLSDVSIETPGSDESEPMAMGLSVSLGCGATDADSTAAYVVPTPGGPGCRLPEAACSPVAVSVAGRGEYPAPGAGRLLVVAVESPKLASSLAFRLPSSMIGQNKVTCDWSEPLIEVLQRVPFGALKRAVLYASVGVVPSPEKGRKWIYVGPEF